VPEMVSYKAAARQSRGRSHVVSLGAGSFAFALLSLFPMVFAGLVDSTPAYGGTIDLGTLLVNPSFEAGNDASGCPIDWTCGGSPTPGFSSYLVTSAQYTAGSDGLTSGIVPDGTHAATSPTFVEGSGTLSQTGVGTYDSTDTYVLNLWIGTPLTVPEITPSEPAGPVGRITVYFLGAGGGQVDSFDATIPAPGQWVPESFSFTPSAGGQPIGIELFVGGGGNNDIANFDMTGSGGPAPPLVGPGSVPEPGTLFLLGMGIASLYLLRRKFAASGRR